MSAYPKPMHKFGLPTEFAGGPEHEITLREAGWFDSWEEANRFENRHTPEAPAELRAWATVATNTGAATPITTGDSGDITNTTPTAIVTFQPANTGQNVAEIDGYASTSATGNSKLRFYIANGTAADVIVIGIGSYCDLLP